MIARIDAERVAAAKPPPTSEEMLAAWANHGAQHAP
jgi:hypothetical protein